MKTPLPENAVHPVSRAAWRAWLTKHHARPDGVWLVSFKKSTGKQAFDYDAAVEEALCFGWVDSKPAKLDDERTMLWFAPRKSKSGWSRPNQIRVAKMTAASLMTTAGQKKIDDAKRDGSWSKLDAVEALEIPPDLAAALDAHPSARANFTAFPRSAKRGILEWIANAKKAETRAARVTETAVLAAQNVRANAWPRPVVNP